ncbi:MAG: proton-conducting transporter membrane subunit [Planctomycetaceae bacterium]
MSDLLTGTNALGLIIVGTPAVLVMALGLMTLCDRRPSEQTTGRLVQAVNIIGLTAVLLMLCSMLIWGQRHVPVDLGNWVHIGEFHFRFKLIFDRLSIPFVVLTFALCGTVGAFCVKYLHREAGYHRFFMMYSIFVMGMVLTASAGTIETLFVGWEFVGLSSAFLVAFFQERPAPVRNGLRVWAIYRVSDAALLLAAVALHHVRSGGDFDQLLSVDSWPDGETALNSTQAFWIGLLFLISAAGKSALIPFSGWLPRAMEGPTPSSAVFYGALSVHLGAFLMFRFGPLLAQSPALKACVLAIGLATALFAAVAGRADGHQMRWLSHQ